VTGGLPLGGGHVGVHDYRVLDQKELVAVGEGGGLNRHAVVSAAPRREVQLARLACRASLGQVLHERRYGFCGQRPPKEVGFTVGVALRRLPKPIVVASPRIYWAVNPPSIANAAPVTNAASSLSRKATKAAISSGRATRPDGFGAGRSRRPCPRRLRTYTGSPRVAPSGSARRLSR